MLKLKNIINDLSFKKIKRISKRLIYSYYYKDAGSDKDTLIIIGSGRSGTTWLAYLLSKLFNYRLIFEPFYHLHLNIDGQKDFFHHRYIDDDCDVYDNYIMKVVGGKINNLLSNHNYKYGPYNGRVIKEICGNLFMHRVKKNVPEIPIIYLLRHPYSVIRSRLERSMWYSDWGEHVYLYNKQKNYIDKYFNGEKIYPKNIIEEHAITYCHENYLPFLKYAKEGIYNVFVYEKLRNSYYEIEKLINFIERKIAIKRDLKRIDNVDQIISSNRKQLDKITIDYINKELNHNNKIIVDTILKKFDLIQMKDFIESMITK